MKITLIRHTTPDVPAGTCYGQTDVPLRNSFEQEAAIVKEKLDNLSFDSIYTSPLSRCTRLAQYCGYDDAISDDRLMEINFGEWEMQQYDKINDPRLQDYYADFFHTAATGGESFMTQLLRVEDFLRDLEQKQPEHAAIFSHGGTIACIQIITGIHSVEDCFKHQAPFGGVETFTFHEKKIIDRNNFADLLW